MCRVASLALADDLRSPARARAWTEMWLASWEIDDEGITTLLVSELVTNAVRHTRDSSTLTLAVAGGVIEVGVTDSGSFRRVIPAQRTVLTPASSLTAAESGRGLLIVEALSDSWGVTPAGKGKQVWFRRPVVADWRYARMCVCAADGYDGHHLPSGHHARDMPRPWDTDPGDAGTR
jgi:anti-sigma regulatory factor (Ser/Thr protein kinase)